MSGVRSLPNFVHFGTPKSGSGTLSYLFVRHPQIYTPRPKELNFFNNSQSFAKGVDWYAETYFANYNGELVSCDKSIGYATGNPEQTMDRIVEALGRDFRILLTMRNPIERAYSHYCMARYKAQIESLGFTEAVRSALEVDGRYSSDDLHEAVDKQGYYNSAHHMAIFRHAMYVVPGQYARLLELCRSTVGDANVHVVFTDDMKKDLSGTLRGLTDFLAVDPIAVDEGFRRNEATALRFPWLRRAYNKVYAVPAVRRLYESMNGPARKSIRKKLLSWNYRPNTDVPPAEPEGQRLLREYYAADIEALQRMTGRDLAHWLQVEARDAAR